MRKPSVLLAFALCAGTVVADVPPVTDLGLLPGDSGIVPATNAQQEHTVAKGGAQYLVVWSDYRGRSAGGQSVQGDGDILGIRLDTDGAPIDAAPFLIAGGMGLQQRPTVAWNGQTWLVVYTSQDPVGGYYDNRLRGVRVSAHGVVLDATPILFPVPQYSAGPIGLQVAGQGGQWLVTRCVYHDDGYGTYLAGQRIADNGQFLDASPSMLLDWVYGQTKTVVANGEYLVAGPDWSNASTIKARRIGLNGLPLGAAFNVPSLTIASSGTEYYVAWVADYVNLVGSRMTATGTLLTPAGTLIVPGFSQYTHATLAHDGLQWWLEWGAADQLRTVRVDALGSVLDPGGGVLLPLAIGGNINNAYDPVLAPRVGAGVLLFWYDVRVALGYDTNVFTLPISATNEAGDERCVSTGSTNQRNPDFADGPGRSAAVVFISEAANDDAVLVHLLDAAGSPTTSDPIEVFRGPTVGKAGIAWNGSLYLVTWDRGVAGSSPTEIMARRLNPDGTFVDATPFVVMPGFNPDVEALGADFLVAGSRFGTYPQNIFLFGNRIAGVSGTPLDGPSGVYLGGFYVSGMPRVRSDGTRWLVAAHSMWTHDSSQGDAILAVVPPSGPPTQAFNPTPISGGSGDLDVAFSGHNYLLVWRMNSLANANNYIAGRIMNADGSFPGGYFTIAEAPGRQLRPTVGWDGMTYVVAWDDQRNQSAFFDARTDTYAARVSDAGVVLDPAGFPVFTGPDGDAAVALLCHPDGASLLAAGCFTVTPPLDSYRVRLARVGTPTLLVGDLNCDCLVDFRDINLFVEALGCPGGTGWRHPECPWQSGDCNGDGNVTFKDIDPFVARMGTGCQ